MLRAGNATTAVPRRHQIDRGRFRRADGDVAAHQSPAAPGSDRRPVRDRSRCGGHGRRRFRLAAVRRTPPCSRSKRIVPISSSRSRTRRLRAEDAIRKRFRGRRIEAVTNRRHQNRDRGAACRMRRPRVPAPAGLCFAPAEPSVWTALVWTALVWTACPWPFGFGVRQESRHRMPIATLVRRR